MLGWDQVANGNSGQYFGFDPVTERVISDAVEGWPSGLGVAITPQQTGPDIWTFGIVNGKDWSHPTVRVGIC
jgi:hypothetical protein